MHVFLGIAVTLLAFIASHYATDSFQFGGLLNIGAVVLLLIGPIGITMIAHPFEEWMSHFRVLLRAFSHDRNRNLAVASEEMATIGRAWREARVDDADRTVRNAQAEQVRMLAPHLLARLEGEALSEAVGGSAFRWMAEVKSADDFFQGLARVSPAFGMIGTIMGLVELFKNMRDSSSLGPGMAMALLATLYGLILCYCVYMPLAQRIRTYLMSGAQEQRAIERGIHLIVDGRPIRDVRIAVMSPATEAATEAGPHVEAEAGSR